jgi:hypothetical protein
MIEFLKTQKIELLSKNSLYLREYKTTFIPLHTSFNPTQTLLTDFLCIDSFLSLNNGLKFISNFFIRLRQPIKIEEFHSGIPLYRFFTVLKTTYRHSF